MCISLVEMTGSTDMVYYWIWCRQVANHMMTKLLLVCVRALGFYDTLAYLQGFGCQCEDRLDGRVCENVESDVSLGSLPSYVRLFPKRFRIVVAGRDCGSS